MHCTCPTLHTGFNLHQLLLPVQCFSSTYPLRARRLTGRTLGPISNVKSSQSRKIGANYDPTTRRQRERRSKSSKNGTRFLLKSETVKVFAVLETLFYTFSIILIGTMRLCTFYCVFYVLSEFIV